MPLLQMKKSKSQLSNEYGDGQHLPLKPKSLQKLGNNEKYQLGLYLEDKYRGTSVSCRYDIPITLDDGQLTRTVTAAIAQTILQHPVLQVGILNAESLTPTWVQLERLDLSQHISWRCLSEGDFETLFQDIVVSQLDASYPGLETCPGWRIVVMHQQHPKFLEILFTWNHPHADGMSGKIFQEDLSKNLATVNTESMEKFLLPNNVLKLPESAPNLPPPLEILVKLPVSTMYTARAVWKEYGPLSLTKDPNWACWAPIRTSPYRTHTRQFSVDNDALSRVLTASRRNKSTLTSLFHGLAIFSLASRLEKNTAPSFLTKTALNMRRLLPSNSAKYPWLQPERTMANYVTTMGHLFSAEEVAEMRSMVPAADSNERLSVESLDRLWLAAARVRGEIQHRLDMGLKDDLAGLLKFVPDWRKHAIDSAQKPRETSVFVSNLGVIGEDACHSTVPAETPPSGRWQPTRAQFSLSAEVASSALMVSLMSAPGGQLCVELTWQHEVLTTALAEGFIDDLQRWLSQIAQ